MVPLPTEHAQGRHSSNLHVGPGVSIGSEQIVFPVGVLGQLMGHAKVRYGDADGVHGSHENVGGPQVPMKDTQLVQMHQPIHALPQYVNGNVE